MLFVSFVLFLKAKKRTKKEKRTERKTKGEEKERREKRQRGRRRQEEEKTHTCCVSDESEPDRLGCGQLRMSKSAWCFGVRRIEHLTTKRKLRGRKGGG